MGCRGGPMCPPGTYVFRPTYVSARIRIKEIVHLVVIGKSEEQFSIMMHDCIVEIRHQ